MSLLKSRPSLLFLATSLFVSACAVDSPDLGDPVAGSDEAIHGGQAESGYPAVGYVSSSIGSCTGELISPEVVLTANHCLGSSMTFSTGTSSASFVSHTVDRTFSHPSQDLLLLHLATPIRDIRPMDINTDVLPAVSSICTAVGFGAHQEASGALTYGNKRSALVRVVSADSGTIQTNWNTGIADHGDSGGPLVCDGRISSVARNRSLPDSGVPTWINYTPLDAVWITNLVADYSSEPTSSTVAWAANRLDTFARGSDGAMYHKAWDGAHWSGWESLAGFLTGTPEAVSWGANRLDIFARGGDMALYHKAWAGAWYPSVSGWDNLGGVLSGHPSVVSWGANRLDIFGLGTDGQMYHKAWDTNAWYPSVTGWEALGGEFKGPIKAVSWASGRLDIFGTGMDGALYHKAWAGAWYPSVTDWEYLGGDVVGSISATTWSANRIDIVAKGTDGAVYHKAWAGAWYPSVTGWDYLGGQFKGSPVMSSWGPDRLDIFGTGTDGALYHKAWANAWYPSATGWESLGGVLAGAPNVVSWAANRLDIFADGTNFALYHKAWDGSRWAPGVNDWEPQYGVLSW